MLATADRYSRQTLFFGVGKEGQKRLASSHVAIIGCGARGTVIATSLARAGVGKITIIDRDSLEYHNLQQQILFNEDDVRNQLPKAIAAERHLKKINSSIEIEGIVAHVNYANIERLASGANLILDGLDNLETRFLVNDVSLKSGVSWIYGEAVASRGMTITIVPGQTPCYQCVFANPFSHGTIYTPDISGIIGPAPFIVGSLQSVEAIKLLVGASEINRDHIVIDVWKGSFHRLRVSPRRDCPACQGRYEFLEGKFGIKTTTICGQDAVQVLNPEVGSISLENLAAHLEPTVPVVRNEFMLRFVVDSSEIVVFPDARAIIKNTTDEAFALALYTKYIGEHKGKYHDISG